MLDFAVENIDRNEGKKAKLILKAKTKKTKNGLKLEQCLCLSKTIVSFSRWAPPFITRKHCHSSPAPQ